MSTSAISALNPDVLVVIRLRPYLKEDMTCESGNLVYVRDYSKHFQLQPFLNRTLSF